MCEDHQFLDECHSGHVKDEYASRAHDHTIQNNERKKEIQCFAFGGERNET